MSQSDSYPNWVFSVFSAIGFVLCCVPFPWHLQGKLLPLRWCLLLTGSILAWNAGTCLVMAWLGLTCLGLCINSIIWKGNSIDWAPVWCDICEFHHAPYRDIEVLLYFPVTRLFYGINIGIPAASLCINRRLYLIASVRKVTISKADKRNQIVVDLAIGLGIPIIFIICRKYLAKQLSNSSSNFFRIY